MNEELDALSIAFGNTVSIEENDKTTAPEEPIKSKSSKPQKKQKLTILIDAKLAREFRVHCVKKGITYSSGIEELIRKSMSKL